MRQFAYGIALFISSACGLVIEIVAGRLLAPYVGMSLYTWTAIIAVVLAGLSAGHWIGGLLAHAKVGPRSGERRISVALALASISSLASLTLLRVLSSVLLDGSLTPIPAIIALTTALFFLPSLFVGIVSPILTKLAIDDRPNEHGPVIGRMYALGTLGSIAGTLLAGYVFISWIGSTGTVVGVTLVYAALALGFAISDPLRLLLVAFLALSISSLMSWGEKVQALVNPCTVESDYFCIRIADFSDQSGRDSALMVLDHLVHSINDRADPGLLYSPYIHFVDEISKVRQTTNNTLADDDMRAFFIGGGGYSLPRAWGYEYPKAELIVAEVDPAVTEAAHNSLYLPYDLPGLSIHHRDARSMLQSLPAAGQFDVIFGDAFHDISIPPHLVTREFHGEVARRLKPSGFYVINAVDRGSNPRFLLSLVHTLKQDFRHVEVWVERSEFGQNGRVTFVVLSSNIASPSNKLIAIRGEQRSWIRWPSNDLNLRIANFNPPELTDDFAPVDRLMSQLLFNSL